MPKIPDSIMHVWGNQGLKVAISYHEFDDAGRYVKTVQAEDIAADSPELAAIAQAFNSQAVIEKNKALAELAAAKVALEQAAKDAGTAAEKGGAKDKQIEDLMKRQEDFVKLEKQIEVQTSEIDHLRKQLQIAASKVRTIDDYRREALFANDRWWDSLPPIEVLPGILLGHDLSQMNWNKSEAKDALAENRPAKILDYQDLTVAVNPGDIVSAMTKFAEAYGPDAAKWDANKKSVLAAETVEAIQEIIYGITGERPAPSE